jgi:hypothetical protein
VRSVFFVLPPQWLQPKGARPVFYAVLLARRADDRPYTHQARLSSSLRNQLRQREKLPNPPIHDLATTG